jgi:hypothetical protein
MGNPSTPAGFRLKAALAAPTRPGVCRNGSNRSPSRKSLTSLHSQWPHPRENPPHRSPHLEPCLSPVMLPALVAVGKNTNVAAVKTPRRTLIRGFGQLHDPVFTPIKDNSLGTETRSMYTSGQAAQMLLMAERQNRSRSTISTKSARRMGSHGS